MPRKIITLCSSANFYKHVAELADELEEMGYKTIIPVNAYKMRETGDYEVSHYKTWYENPHHFHKKRAFMDEHIEEIEKADAILIVNDTKRGVKGYIGPNSLMEMAVAYYLKKPIFILNKIGKDNNVYEEVMGMEAIILNGNVRKLKL